MQLSRARRIERNLSGKQRALLFLSGVSLTGRRTLLSGISSVELICSATVFLRCNAAGSACVQRAVCALLHILVLKGFVLKLQPLVGRNPAKTKPKIQGFTPTDKWPAVRLVSMRAENTRPSDKAQQPRVRGQRSVVRGRFRGPTRIVSDVGPPNSDLRGAWP